MAAQFSDRAGVDTTVYEPYDGGDPANRQHTATAGGDVAWHRRISGQTYLWLIVVGAIGGLWLIAGSFRKVLS